MLLLLATGMSAVDAESPATISNLRPDTCVNAGENLTIVGTNLGSARRYRLVAADRRATYPLRTSSWDQRVIVATIPATSVFQPGRAFAVGLRDELGLWVSNTDHRFTICGGAASSLERREERPPSQNPPSGSDYPLMPGYPGYPGGSGPGTTPDGPEAPGTDSPTAPGALEVLPQSGGSMGSTSMGSLDAPAPASADGEYEPGELLAVHGDLASAQQFDGQVAASGGRLLRRRNLKGLGFVVSAYRFAGNREMLDALKALTPGFEGLALDVNGHFETLDKGREQRRGLEQALKWRDALVACSEGLRIGMLDTGVLVTHEALLGRGVRQRNFLPAGRESAAEDHGTAVATILIGNRNTGFGGLLPDAQLFAGAVFRRDGRRTLSTAEWLVLGLDWLITEQVRVINLSLGGPYNRIVEIALQKALGLDVIVVAAAGADKSRDPLYPAYMPGVVAVTAVDTSLDAPRAAPSGTYVSFAAPGIDVWSGDAKGGGSYFSGTSYAAPFVTAALAAAGSNGYATLSRGARDLGSPGRDPVYGWGLIQFGPGCDRSSSH